MLEHEKCNKHPHVIGIKGIVMAKGSLCLVMEYASLGSIATLLDKRNCVSEAEAKQFLHQILLGLQHCHAQGVYHRSVCHA